MKQLHTPDLVNNPFIQALAKVLEDHPQVASQIGRPTGGQRAKIVDVDDPLERGRVRVIFDPYNKEDVPAQTGAGGEYQNREGKSQVSHWVDCCPSFKGKQPPGLVGKRVLVNTTDGELHYAVLGDVLNDPELLVPDAASKLKSPNNSAMTRLPVYPSNQLPPPVKENIGCTVIEEGGPMGSDWLCVCLKRNGKYFWVRHVDLSHAHAGGDDCVQPPSASGEKQNNVYMGCTSSDVCVTTGIRHLRDSEFSEKPCGNPFQMEACQPLPPMAELSDPDLVKNWVNPEDLKDFDLLTKCAETGFPASFVRGPAQYFNDTIAGFKASFNPEIPLLYEPAALEAFQKAQEVLKTAETLKKAVAEPDKFIEGEALAFAKGAAQNLSVPPGTEAALKSVTSSGFAVTKTLQSVIPSLTGGVLSAVKKVLSV